MANGQITGSDHTHITAPTRKGFFSEPGASNAKSETNDPGTANRPTIAKMIVVTIKKVRDGGLAAVRTGGVEFILKQDLQD